MAAHPRAVLFDVDGTVVDTTYLPAVTWWQAFAQAGHDVPMAPSHRPIGIGPGRASSAGPRELAVLRAGAAPEQAVFVGDSVWDARARQLAGVRCIGVRSGGTGEAELRDAGVTEVYRGPAEILSRLPDSLPG